MSFWHQAGKYVVFKLERVFHRYDSRLRLSMLYANSSGQLLVRVSVYLNLFKISPFLVLKVALGMRPVVSLEMQY